MIKNESGSMIEIMISTEHRNRVFYDTKYPDRDTLIVSAMRKRQRIMHNNIEQGMEHIRKRYSK